MLTLPLLGHRWKFDWWYQTAASQKHLLLLLRFFGGNCFNDLVISIMTGSSSAESKLRTVMSTAIVAVLSLTVWKVQLQTNETIYHCEYVSCKFLWFRSRRGNSNLPLGFMQEWTHPHLQLECSCFLQHFLPECILTHERGNRQKRFDGGDSITKASEAIQILMKRQILTIPSFGRRNYFQQELIQYAFPLRSSCRLMLKQNCDEGYWRITYSVYETSSSRHVVSNIGNN